MFWISKSRKKCWKSRFILLYKRCKNYKLFTYFAATFSNKKCLCFIFLNVREHNTQLEFQSKSNFTLYTISWCTAWYHRIRKWQKFIRYFAQISRYKTNGVVILHAAAHSSCTLTSSLSVFKEIISLNRFPHIHVSMVSSDTLFKRMQI